MAGTRSPVAFLPRGAVRLQRITFRKVRLLLRAAWVVAFVRLALWVLPWRVIAAGMRRLEQTPPARTNDSTTDARELAWAIRIAARRIPGATCLTQGLAGQWLLKRAGHSARLRVGVRRNPVGRFEAHAWLECCDEILVGQEIAGRFKPLPAIPVAPGGAIRR
jgi:hypothetical protein